MTTGLQMAPTSVYDELFVTDFVLYMSCEEGYAIDDPQLSAIRCNEDGDWNSTFPTCLKSLFFINHDFNFTDFYNFSIYIY